MVGVAQEGVAKTLQHPKFYSTRAPKCACYSTYHICIRLGRFVRRGARYLSRKRLRPRGLFTNKFAYYSCLLTLFSVAAAIKHKTWRVAGLTDRVEDRWALVVEDLSKEPYVRVFGSKTVKHLKSRFDSHIRAQAKKNEEAAKASGAGNTSADDLEGDEAELVRS